MGGSYQCPLSGCKCYIEIRKNWVKAARNLSVLFLRNAGKPTTMKIKTSTNKLDRDAWCTISLIRYRISPTDLG